MDNNIHPANEETSEINLMELLMILIDKIWIICVCAVLAAIISFVYFGFIVSPTYTAKSSIYVEMESDSASTSTLSLASSIAKDYPYLMTSRTILNQVASNLNYDRITEKVSVTSPSSTDHILEITVNSTDPIRAAAIANEIINVSSEVIPLKYASFTHVNIREVYTAVVPTSPSAPSVLRNTVLFGILGGLAAAGIIIVTFILSAKIRSEDDVERSLGLSVLAIIPNCNDEGKRKNIFKKYYTKYYNKYYTAYKK